MTEIREAAERIRRQQYDQHGGEFLIGPNGEKWSRSMDGHTVANAYLAEHPTDDEEPVTESWLESCGGNVCHGCEDEPGSVEFGKSRTLSLVLSQYDDMEFWRVFLEHPSSKAFAMHDQLPDVNTRGNVRRLCAALGITLKGES